MWINGILTQDFNTRDMANSVARSVGLGEYHPYAGRNPGDVIATGTHHAGLSPLQDRDVVEMQVQGLGKLTFSVRDD